MTIKTTPETVDELRAAAYRGETLMQCKLCLALWNRDDDNDWEEACVWFAVIENNRHKLATEIMWEIDRMLDRSLWLYLLSNWIFPDQYKHFQRKVAVCLANTAAET